ncbi:CDP-alcohol phosphatidyltransferase family protein [Arenibacter aquaticus]|uniref:CDP-alcohol phosphatidyltransferase family protein n=1 Tax=Arenibacter aquaticus TaxID=2489054 RepID=A0A3S0ACY1_9FLAO|nr:CDP-alcohol phosphatidyltransferase family protein [Arenibacter aquaticus]RTE52637.1 CDP-alcohol phosphatidyltransferase family protein [Arenibacter aquaticus]
MSKLPKNHTFLDLSDYGRFIARFIARALQPTGVTPIHVTIAFFVSGLLAIWCILFAYYWAAAFFLILKSVLDAADGELSRLKNAPSYTGRYLDSVSDIVLNILLFLAIWYTTDAKLIMAFLALFGMQLQGTLYNYYYVILRNRFKGDITSRVFETTAPVALEGELQSTVDVLFWWYKTLYGNFDRIIYLLDPRAAEGGEIPNWFMTLVSTFGLGFQLLLIALLLVLGLIDFVIPLFVIYTLFVFMFIGIRKAL